MAESVSVVIPFFGDDRWFPTTLASVLAQDREPDEVIVIDDASPPGTALTLTRVPKHVKVIRLAQNGGPGRARQIGTEAATSSLVTFIDSDDRWPPEFLACCLDQLSRDPASAAVYTAIAKRHPDGTLTEFVTKPALLDIREAIVRFHAYPALAMVFRRERLLAIGGWDTGSCAVEDWDLVVRFLDHFGPIPLVVGPLPEYRVGHEPGRLNSAAWRKIRHWHHTAWRNRELLERHYGHNAHRRRFAQAVRDRAARTGGFAALAMRVVGRTFGTPLDSLTSGQ